MFPRADPGFSASNDVIAMSVHRLPLVWTTPRQRNVLTTQYALAPGSMSGPKSLLGSIQAQSRAFEAAPAVGAVQMPADHWYSKRLRCRSQADVNGMAARGHSCDTRPWRVAP